MRYYVFEGPDGSGKSTLLQAVGQKLLTSGYVVQFTRSPGQTSLGQQLRKMVLEGSLNIDELSRQILFMADTVNYYETYLKPLLRESKPGTIVLQDRSSYISSVVYGMADGLKFEPLARMLSIYKPIRASKVFIMDTPAEICHERRVEATKFKDIYDVKPLEFYKKCANTYSQFLTDSSLRLLLSDLVWLYDVDYISSNWDLDGSAEYVTNVIKADFNQGEQIPQ